MVQKEVEDIFAKTKNIDKFKKANTSTLARSFLTLYPQGAAKMRKQATKITEEKSLSRSSSELKNGL